MYAREGDSFTQTPAVNDRMTGCIYQNWHDAKAFQHYMLACPAISDANKRVIQEFLQASREGIAAYYGADAKVAKELRQRLTFGGGFKAPNFWGIFGRLFSMKSAYLPCSFFCGFAMVICRLYILKSIHNRLNFTFHYLSYRVQQ